MGIDGKFQKFVKIFLSNRCQHVVLNGEASSGADVKVGVSQASMLSSQLFFLICINDFSENLKSTAKLFADYAPIFHVAKDPQYIS